MAEANIEATGYTAGVKLATHALLTGTLREYLENTVTAAVLSLPLLRMLARRMAIIVLLHHTANMSEDPATVV